MLTLFLLLALPQDKAPAQGVEAEVRHVIHISVDGLRGDALEQLLASEPERFPNFGRLAREGAGTFNARTDHTYTVTLPNHASMLTGRPVTAPDPSDMTLHHGYVKNTSPSKDVTLHNEGNPDVDYVASVFDVVHDSGRTTALFASKPKFVVFNQSWDEDSGAEDKTGDDNGRDKIDRFETMSLFGTAGGMNEVFVEAMGTEHYHYSFVHYLDPDVAGHSFGWGGREWVKAVERVDGYLGALFALLDQSEDLRGRTALILSADHGGTGKGHADTYNPEVFTIPFFVWGPTIPEGRDLYELSSATRGNPGATSPSYLADKQPIRNGDGGNLALQLLGLGPIPGSSINAAQDLLSSARGKIAVLRLTLLLAALGEAFGRAMVELLEAN